LFFGWTQVGGVPSGFILTGSQRQAVPDTISRRSLSYA
jgi:hypothetical protein